MHTKILKLMSITICVLSSVAAYAQQSSNAAYWASIADDSSNSDVYIMFPKMPTGIRTVMNVPLSTYQCLSTVNNARVKNILSTASAYCLDSPKFTFSETTTADGVAARTLRLISDNNLNLCLDVANGKVEEGNSVNLRTCKSSNESQKWLVSQEAGSSFTLKHTKNKTLCIDISADSQSSPIGSNIVLGRCSNAISQSLHISTSPIYL